MGLKVLATAGNNQFGMKVTSKDLPMLAVNSCGVVVLLVNNDKVGPFSNDECDAIVLTTAGSRAFEEGEFVMELNLDNWLPYSGTVTLSNAKGA